MFLELADLCLSVPKQMNITTIWLLYPFESLCGKFTYNVLLQTAVWRQKLLCSLRYNLL